MSVMVKDVSTHGLLLRLKKGQEEILDELYPRYARAFYTYARRHHLSHEDAEDVVQTTFWHVLDHIQSYEESWQSGEKWLWSICRNQVIDHLRRQKMNPLPDAEMLVEEFDPDDYLMDQERLLLLTHGWAALAECDREEIRRGRGRGSGRKAWHAAIVKLGEIKYLLARHRLRNC